MFADPYAMQMGYPGAYDPSTANVYGQQQQFGDYGTDPFGMMFGGGMPGFNADGSMALGGNSPDQSIGGGGILGFMSGGNTPQDRGFGISNPTPVMPYSTGPGLQQGDPSGYQGFDLSQQGTGEQFWGMTGGNYMQQGQGEKAWDQYGGNYAQPGAAEDWYAKNGAKFSDPGMKMGAYSEAQHTYQNKGMGEKYAQGAVNRYAQGTPQGTANTQDAYDAFKANRPQISTDAGLDPYYKNAEKRALTSLSRQQAARGVYGSTAALNDTSRAITDLNAERANREADYNLRAIGEQRAWEGLGGQMAQGADQGSLARSQNELAWTQGLNNIAQGGQAAEQSRANAGMAAALDYDAATRAGLNAEWGAAQGAQGAMLDRTGQALAGAQNAQNATLGRLAQGQGYANQNQGIEQGRGQQLFDNNLAMNDRQNAMMQHAYDQMFAEQQALMDAAIASELGLGAEAVNQSYRTQQGVKDDASWMMDMMSGAMSMGGGGGGGGMLGGLMGG